MVTILAHLCGVGEGFEEASDQEGVGVTIVVTHQLRPRLVMLVEVGGA